jgi:hypothetical protein
MTEKDEIAELRREAAAQKARIEELERKAKPPEPFNPGDYQPIDWTARMSMPLSTVREMAQATPTDMLHNIAMRDNRAPTGPGSAIPSSQQLTNVRGSNVVRGTGWVDAAPLTPPPGIRWVDAQLDAQDAKDRAERIAQEAKINAALGRK